MYYSKVQHLPSSPIAHIKWQSAHGTNSPNHNVFTTPLLKIPSIVYREQAQLVLEKYGNRDEEIKGNFSSCWRQWTMAEQSECIRGPQRCGGHIRFEKQLENEGPVETGGKKNQFNYFLPIPVIKETTLSLYFPSFSSILKSGKTEVPSDLLGEL